MVVIKDVGYNDLFPADLVYDSIGNVYLVAYVDDELFLHHPDRIEIEDLCLIRLYHVKTVFSEVNYVKIDLTKNKDFVYLPELKKAANLNELEW